MSTDVSSSSREIMQFLADRSRSELRINDDDHSYLFIRSPFDAETDFIYMCSNYSSGKDPRRVGGAADFAGIYSHLRDVIVTPHYYIKELVGNDRVASLAYEVEAVERRASEIVEQIALRGPVQETEEAEVPFDDEEHFAKYDLESETLTHFMDGSFPQYKCHVEIRDSKTAAVAVQIINHPEDAAQEYARQHIVKYAKYINLRLSRLPRLMLRLVQLTATPGDHHLRRAIAASIQDEKMVRVDVERDGRQLTVRIEACALKYTGGNHYSTYRMDASSRKAFEAAFGRAADLMPQDIQRIVHGGKTLYEKAKVPQTKVLELTPDQLAMACCAV